MLRSIHRINCGNALFTIKSLKGYSIQKLTDYLKSIDSTRYHIIVFHCGHNNLKEDNKYADEIMYLNEEVSALLFTNVQ
jgi:hypothetical protein